MTFGQIQAEIRRRIAAASTGEVFWSDQEIADAANVAYMEIADEAEWNEAVLEIDLLEDRPYYDLWTLLGPTFLALRPCFDPQTNRWLIGSTVRQLDANDRRWERVTGEPQRMFMHGLRWLGLFPRIQTDVGQVKIYHTALPAPLVDDDDEPGFPDLFHYTIVDGALTELWADDGETAYALAAWKAYLKGEADLVAWVQGRGALPTMHGFDSPGAGAVR